MNISLTNKFRIMNIIQLIFKISYKMRQTNIKNTWDIKDN